VWTCWYRWCISGRSKGTVGIFRTGNIEKTKLEVEPDYQPKMGSPAGKTQNYSKIRTNVGIQYIIWGYRLSVLT
jgi:hypothetical protein